MLSLFENSILTRKDGTYLAKGRDVLKDKKVGLYFASCNKTSKEFTQKLNNFYKIIKEKGEENFEIIFISCEIRKADKRKCIKFGHQDWLYLQLEYPAMM
uniref:Thioredoxin-like fold domain-containing protein n=1 Tax=Acrobeloides nanus TaxID=290746 RepID=A0A914EC16_9BILA